LSLTVQRLKELHRMHRVFTDFQGPTEDHLLKRVLGNVYHILEPSVMRVNLANVLDEGRMIGGRGRGMNSKVKISQIR
jgi:hypothetical protein